MYNSLTHSLTPASLPTSYSSMSISVDTCTNLFNTLGYAVVTHGDGGRSLCDGLTGVYSIGAHVGGVFLVLFASLFGVVLPFLTKYVKCLGNSPFFFTIGKTAATGVLLSVSTVHLINEAVVALEEHCIPAWLATYEAFAFLFALIGVLLMQALDLELANIVEGWVQRKRDREAKADDVPSEGIVDSASDTRHTDLIAPESTRVLDEFDAPVMPSNDTTKQVPREEAEKEAAEHCVEDGVAHSHAPAHHHDTNEMEFHAHSHAIVLPPAELGTVRQIIAAICMEFGVALHSIFVGVAMGLTADRELKPLLVALFFHQLFEGMAMGSRIVEASFHGKLEIALSLIFATSAPIGMAIAICVVSGSRDAMSGGSFVATMGIMDAFCGGILLYLAFTLLLIDFPQDLRRYCSHGQPKSTCHKVGLFAALWIGMLLMAGIGNWL